ncbi:Hypothetical_protein [Hexamita inflata]|uniref:Hypothetical_protein n=1 Tax=Hexamita inflata TaxID=28002 RepID=A0AA86PQY9_9EUKA|nr:Hypothetical protein HINF_LOCUS30746 [Hexamita inflata]
MLEVDLISEVFQAEICIDQVLPLSAILVNSFNYNVEGNNEAQLTTCQGTRCLYGKKRFVREWRRTNVQSIKMQLPCSAKQAANFLLVTPKWLQQFVLLSFLYMQ